MFAPNVWSFDPPNTQFTYKYSESDRKHVKQINKRIQNHPFNRMVSNICLIFRVFCVVRVKSQ